MNFKDLDLKSTYKSLGRENILNSFLLPTLSFSKEYRRSVWFFTLSSLVELFEGIQTISESNGSIKIISSPKITKEDFELITDAY